MTKKNGVKKLKTTTATATTRNQNGIGRSGNDYNASAENGKYVSTQQATQENN